MTLSQQERQIIIDYRFERARTAIEEAAYVAKGNFWNLAANRLYYAVFYACEALLISKGIATQTHAGLNRMMNLHFIKTGLLNDEDKNILTNLFRMRQTGDYEDLTDWSENEVTPYIDKAKYLIDKIENLTKSQ